MDKLRRLIRKVKKAANKILPLPYITDGSDLIKIHEYLRANNIEPSVVIYGSDSLED